MAASSAPIAGSKLLNLRAPLLRKLLRHPSAAAIPATLDAVPLNLNQMGEGAAAYSPNCRSSGGWELSPRASDLPLGLQLPFGFSGARIEASRTFVPNYDDNDMVDEDIDEEDSDEDDDDVDDAEAQDYSGSDLDDEDDDGDRPRRRK